MQKILQVKDIKVHFFQKQGLFTPAKTLYAVDGISFDVYRGEVLGIVGESGCGKSSLAKSIVGLNPVTSGSMVFNENVELVNLKRKNWRDLYKDIQFIFQDPVASLNPKMTIMEILSEPLIVNQSHLNKSQIRAKVIAMMQQVGLSKEQINRYPQELSGGQCQRVGIARALILEPKLLICDESVSALDVSIKAQIINLLKDLQQKLTLTIIFISHDLSIIKHICDRVMVMYLGNVMEVAPKNILYTDGRHPYTKALLSAIPSINPKIEGDKKKIFLEGDLPSPIDPPLGCVFSTRCPLADNKCRESRPLLRTLDNGSWCACYKV